MDFFSPAWWRDTGERIVRQLVQVVAPVIGAFILNGTRVTPSEVAWTALAVVVFTFLKAAAGITAKPGAPWYWLWADRIGSAAAAALIGLLPADLLQVNDWKGLLLAAGGATFTSLVMLYLAPPTQRTPVAAHAPAGAALLLALLAVAPLTMFSGSAAYADHRAPVAVEHIATYRAYACEGVLLVAYGTERLIGRAWQPTQDDGNVTIQAHEVSSRSGLRGTWQTIPAVSGGEAWRRWPGYADAVQHGSHFDLARTVRHGIASTAVPLTQGCPA